MPVETEDAAITPEVVPDEVCQTDLEAVLAAEKDKFLRLAAEYDNYRKRSIKERESLYNDARADAIVRFLPVYDNLARALKQECADDAF
jgi:molecular chaperone GrpE